MSRTDNDYATAADVWAVETADFRRREYRRMHRDGHWWLVAECASFEGGKWEGFVSMIPDTPEARWSTK